MNRTRILLVAAATAVTTVVAMLTAPPDQGRGKVTLVILNRSSSAVSDAVVQVPQGVSAAEYTVTSRNLSAAPQPADVSGGQVTVDIPARSISTITITPVAG